MRDAREEEKLAKYAPVKATGYSEDHRFMAEAYQAHAREHEAAAKELRAFEAQECAGIDADLRGACPLLQVEAVEDVPDGVVLVLREGTDLERISRLMQCYLAFARAQGFEGAPDCPFYVRGIFVIPVEGRSALRLATKDVATAETLRKRVRQAFAPGDASGEGTGGADSAAGGRTGGSSGNEAPGGPVGSGAAMPCIHGGGAAMSGMHGGGAGGQMGGTPCMHGGGAGGQMGGESCMHGAGGSGGGGMKSSCPCSNGEATKAESGEADGRSCPPSPQP
jgi:hypothetical protein